MAVTVGQGLCGRPCGSSGFFTIDTCLAKGPLRLPSVQIRGTEAPLTLVCTMLGSLIACIPHEERDGCNRLLPFLFTCECGY